MELHFEIVERDFSVKSVKISIEVRVCVLVTGLGSFHCIMRTLRGKTLNLGGYIYKVVSNTISLYNMCILLPCKVDKIYYNYPQKNDENSTLVSTM